MVPFYLKAYRYSKNRDYFCHCKLQRPVFSPKISLVFTGGFVQYVCLFRSLNKTIETMQNILFTKTPNCDYGLESNKLKLRGFHCP